MYAGVSFIASVSFACVSHRHHDVREMATEQQPRSTRVSSWSMCVLQCVSVIEHSCVLTRSMQVHGCVIHRAQSQRQESHGSGKSHRTTATGLPGVGRRPGKARYWGPDHVDKHKHTHTHKRKYTYTYTHTHTRTEPFHSSSFTSPPSVLVTAIRPCHRLSSLSLPFVHVTAIRPSCVAHTAVCSAAMLPCLLSVRAAVVLRGPRSVEMPAVADDDADGLEAR